MQINRTDIFRGGIRPHLYCLPIAKRETHRQAVRAAATSGASCFFLGTDSAPHVIGAKESACGCAGIFNAPVAMALYADMFDEDNALQHLEAFASRNGPAFYGLPVNNDLITLERKTSPVPSPVTCANGDLILSYPSEGEMHWVIKR
jgi:dihydroorotase